MFNPIKFLLCMIGAANAFNSLFQIVRYWQTKQEWHVGLGLICAVAAAAMFYLMTTSK